MARLEALLTNLKTGRKLLSEPTQWCRNTLARNRDGEACTPRNPDAVQWCAYGAGFSATRNELEADDVMNALRRSALDLYNQMVSEVNDLDSNGYCKVQCIYDHAIARIQSQIESDAQNPEWAYEAA